MSNKIDIWSATQKKNGRKYAALIFTLGVNRVPSISREPRTNVSGQSFVAFV